MKKKLILLAAAFPALIFAQNSNPYGSGSEKTEKFTNESRLFKDWAISLGGGGAFMQSADLTSFYDGKVNWGWNGYISIDKQINHTFGVSLNFSKGETKQKAMARPEWGVAEANTKYNQLAILGDVNLSNLMRRVDNKSEFKWAIHAYAGAGIMGYKTRLQDQGIYNKWPIYVEQKLDQGSVFWTTGVGLKYNVSKLIDLELRAMYVFSGDDAFDGSGIQGGRAYDPENGTAAYMQLHPSRSDNPFTVNLGVSFKLGKSKQTHLQWFDPIQNAYSRVNKLETDIKDFVVCEKGDNDNDGVCDDWDRQLDTPAGARVDGAGVALDLDLDGVIDLYDKCVTVPGPIENNGCPVESPTKALIQNNIVNEINEYLKSVEFELNKAVIRPTSYKVLDQAATVIKSLDNEKSFLVIGATDARGSAEYNKKLSQERANAVKAYLVTKGVSSSILEAEGRGKSDLKFPECDPATKCPEWKNEANRRVYFNAK
ncbi:OmpA family protein [Soonwooa sp.]|uniref:OmpA family protein n=1 Tax=Soonwooa sp. TaxID=1938592 RepID=UPI00261476BF|nr:OmpA family protein [Soonwooa sp.]